MIWGVDVGFSWVVLRLGVSRFLGGEFSGGGLVVLGDVGGGMWVVFRERCS